MKLSKKRIDVLAIHDGGGRKVGPPNRGPQQVKPRTPVGNNPNRGPVGAQPNIFQRAASAAGRGAGRVAGGLSSLIGRFRTGYAQTRG